MSKIGFYRYKIENATNQVVTLYVNNIASHIKRIVTKDVCGGFRQLKWIDRNGQYRFYAFNSEHGIKNQPKLIGEKNEFIASLLTSQSDSKAVGYSNDRTITLTASQVGAAELELLSDIYISPRVYYYVGNGSTDEQKDWILVTVAGDAIVRRPKLNFGKVDITIKLPKHYTVNEL
jgi:hypothetical protein